METIEPFGSLDDEWQLTAHSVPLKDGIDIRQLTRGEGTTFEINPSAGEEEAETFDQEGVYEQLNYACTDVGGDSGSESEDAMTPFERMAVGMEDLTGDGGVLKKILRPGTGSIVPEGAIVRVHYNGYLEYAEEPYDSSRLRNRQQQFRLGKGEVIPGWEVGLASMRRTELARFLIQPEYAFGEMGCPPRIPPSARIMFEIELISFVDHRAADEFASFSPEERQQATLEQLIAVANAEREAGNDMFQQKQFGKAANKYMKAIRLLENTRLKDEKEEHQWKQVLVKLYLNLCLCNLRLKKPKPVITHCRKTLELDPENVKAHFRLGQAYMQLSEFKKSRSYFIKAGQLSPGNPEIRQELQKLDKAVNKFQAMEKSMCSKMFHFTPATKTSSSAAANPASTETGRLFMEKLSAFKSNTDMLELVLPASLEPEEIACAQEIAKELDLKTELGAHGIRITKPGVAGEEESVDLI